ncbi:MAG: domain containing protein [Acidimicrobiales bacterium]|nr:domain containing protein [Acidimicrobiales bacterium]
MAYRLDPGEPTAADLRRVLAEQLDASVTALRVPGGPDADAVHDVRKRLKKARSVLRLGRGDLGAAVARQANAELREVGQALSAQRDADALVETVDRLLEVARATDPPATDAPASSAMTTVETATGAGTSAVPDTIPAETTAEEVVLAATGDAATVRAATVAALERLRAGLVAEAAAGRAESGGAGSVVGAAHSLDRAARWLALVPPKADGWAALAPGLRRQYRRGREALATLGDAPTDEQLHEWRKRAKDLWYHLRLLRDAWPKALKPLVDAASALADMLGDDHDLALFRTWVLDQAVLGDERALVLALVDGERAALQARARASGARLYAEPPEAWAGRLGALWQLAGSGGDPSRPIA